MTMGSTVFWGVTSCSPVEGHCCFGGMSKLYWNTWHQILKDSTLYVHTEVSFFVGLIILGLFVNTTKVLTETICTYNYHIHSCNIT
jgi:hypothetical protein